MKRLINLERFKSYLTTEFNKTLKAINEYLQKAVFNQEISELTPQEIKELSKNVDGEIKSFFALYLTKLKNNWRGLFTHRYNAEAPVKKLIKEPKLLQAYADKAFNKPLVIDGSMGVTLDDLLAKFNSEEAKKITNALRLAHSEGLSNTKLIQMIRGSRARQYKDGILATTTRNAETIARTGSAIMASEAKQEFIRKNPDIVKGIRINAKLDSRTSIICRSRDGQFMPIKSAKYPPYHFNCRTSFEIVYEGYVKPPKRASEHGVVENVSYYEWLKQQPHDYQDEVLGKKRAKLFRDGGMSVERFRQLQLDRNFTPLTLEEMRRLEPEAFKRAFGT